jgi:hypothetical protein
MAFSYFGYLVYALWFSFSNRLSSLSTLSVPDEWLFQKRSMQNVYGFIIYRFILIDLLKYL